MVSFDLRGLFNHVIAAFVVIGTFFYVPLPESVGVDGALAFGYASQELYFRYGVFLLLFLSMFVTPLRRCKYGWIAWFFVYSAITSLFMGFDAQIRRQLLNIACGAIFFKICAEYLRTNDLKKFGFWFCAVCGWNLSLCIQQYLGRDPLFTKPANLGHADMMVGFLKMKVHLGAMVAIMAPFILSCSWILGLLCLPLIYWSNSSAAVLCFVTSACGMAIFWALNGRFYRKTIASLVLAIILGSGVYYVAKVDAPGGQFTERFKVWEATYSLGLKNNLFFGSGVSGFAKLNMSTDQKTVSERLVWTWAHNEYIQAFYEFGMVGIGLIFLYVWGCLKAFFRNWYDSEIQVIFFSLLSVFIISFLHFPFHIARLAALCLFVMGLYQARVSDLEDAY